MFYATTFTHFGQSFAIEAEDWPDADSASTTVIALQSWTMNLDPGETEQLHRALGREREALMQELFYDREAPLLSAVRKAQRLAIRAGLQGQLPAGRQPIVTLEAIT